MQSGKRLATRLEPRARLDTLFTEWNNRAMIDLNDLRLFERVAALSGFSATARSLGIPKSSVSRAVDRLETALGIRLLQRTTREVALTVAGQALFERCGTLLAELDDALSITASLAESPKGMLRISAGIGFGINALGAQLPGFLERYPGVHVSLDLTSRNAELVGERVDVAIRMGPLADSGLVATRLAVLTQYLCATPSYLDRHGRPDKPADLERHALVAFSSTSGRPRPWCLQRDDEQTEIVPRPHVDVNDALTLTALVRQGVGIGIVTAYLCGPHILDGTLERVLPEWSLPPLPVHMVFPSRREVAPVARAFVDYMREANAGQTGWLANPLGKP